MAFDLIAALREWKRKVAWLQERWRGARREIERLRKEVEQLRRREKQLEQEREQLREENEKLKRQLEEAQRASQRPAAPFSRGTRKQNPKTPGRKSGAGYGQRFSKLAPPQVDEVIAVPPPTRCSCGGALEVERIEPQYQQEIVRRTFWRRFDIPICRCPVCHKRVPGRDPRQTSAALGAAAVQLGPNALALAVQMNKGFGDAPCRRTTNCISQGKGPSHGGTFDPREPSTGWSTERRHRRQRLGAAETRPSVRALALPARRRPERGTLQPGAWSRGKPTRRVVPVRCKPPSWSCRSPSRREGVWERKIFRHRFRRPLRSITYTPGKCRDLENGIFRRS